MKKHIVVIFVFALLFTLGQSVFAAGSAGLKLGYNGLAKDNELTHSAELSLYGEYAFTDRFSLMSEITGEMIFIRNSAFEVDFRLAAKYKVFSFDVVNLFMEAGATDSLYISNGSLFNTVIFSLGASIRANVVNNLDVYANVSLPMGFLYQDETSGNGGSFFDVFLYDFKLGASYELTKHFSLGLECGMSNDDAKCLYDFVKNDSIDSFSFSVGLKLDYRF